MKVLIVDDNRQVLSTLLDYLEVSGIEADCAYHGEAALQRLREESFDVIVMDIMMPRLDGIETVRALRSEMKVATPLLFLTARDSLDDKTAAYQAGGDDYLIKPFAMEELVMRLQALHRRGAPRSMSLLSAGDLQFDTRTGQLSRAGQPIRLSRIQTDIVRLLLEQFPQLVSRQQIIERVWGEDEPDSDALRSHMYGVRQALHKSFAAARLITVHGKGYRLCVEDE
ncbi:response regulator transcription factor [Oceanobacter mangrovi]|uniref:response regulator transcription factor n=1 Tax=Oceanobacter mangrovi TaxID=2862510 RepID=UPI001C8DBCE5|nr:response regulator transcription factor [Oceanobacter mangrovi]